MLAGIHFQYITDNGEMMEKILSKDKQFFLFIVRGLMDKTLEDSRGEKILGKVYPEDNFYKSWFIDFLKENRKNRKIIPVMEGNMHYCERCFEKFLENGGREKDAWPDPFHEHVCLDGKAQSYNEQFAKIKEGIDFFIETTGIFLRGYCPPNHLSNRDTRNVAERFGFDYFFIRNLLGIPAYCETSNLIVLPEAKLGERRTSSVIYTYYDHLVDGKWEEFEKIFDLSDGRLNLSPSKPFILDAINSQLVKYSKKARDWKKRLGI